MIEEDRMELREPPRPRATAAPDRVTRTLLVVVLAALTAGGGLVLSGRSGSGGSPEARRQLASRLLAAGALDEAAAQYERYLDLARLEPAKRGRICYSVGTAFLDAGRPEAALRWLYEAEVHADAELAAKVAPRLVHALERLGRTHAARAALAARSGLPEEEVRRSADDPVVARIGDDEIHRSQVDRALDDLPPELSAAFADPARRGALLERYVADELLWRKARRLEYDRDPEVLRRQEGLLRQLAVARFVEREVAPGITVDEADLRNHFEVNRERFAAAAGGEPADFERLRPVVERDYRQRKLQSAYEELIAGELAAAEVELFPERMRDDG